MRAVASDLGAYEALEAQTGTMGKHGLTFALLTVEAIGRPWGLELASERSAPEGPWDAVFLSVFDVRCMTEIAPTLRKLRVPFWRAERGASHPLVWAGGQGLSNPVPLAPIADLIVLGDCEVSLPALLRAWDAHPERAAFLAAASLVPGVYVPAHHDWRTDRFRWQEAPPPWSSLTETLSPTLTGSRRVEIARGCPHKCGMCGMAWRSRYREAATEDVLRTIREEAGRGGGGAVMHLQAGDAESHSGIAEIRRTMRHLGCQDQGWTGRLDTIGLEGRIDPTKRFAFGIEGASHRTRRVAGKGWLTDEALIRGTSAVLDAIRVDRGLDTRGRTMWHMIAGLPGERPAQDAQELLAVLRAISARKTRQKVPRNIEVHWQPLQPLPGTPFQWAACGGGCAAWSRLLRPAELLPYARVLQHTGRTDEMARWCTVLCRADERGAAVLERRGTAAAAAEACGAGWGELDPDEPRPWDCVETWVRPEGLRRAWGVVRSRARE